MGKNSSINSAGKVIGNVVVHKILEVYTNRPESVNHLGGEIIEYRNNAVQIANEFNWNASDKKRIKLEALKYFKLKMAKKYGDVKFPMGDAIKFLNQTMNEIGL